MTKSTTCTHTHSIYLTCPSEKGITLEFPNYCLDCKKSWRYNK